MARYDEANCMGYALSVNDWLIPYIWRVDRNATPKHLSKGYNLKPIKKNEMVLGKEYIAFRWTNSKRDSDFHFMKRGRNGHWRHKPGGTPVRPASQKEVFSSVWFSGEFRYDSKIYLFEVE